METAVALIAFALIGALVAPNIISKEIIFALLAIGVLAIVRPELFTREQAFAVVAFIILFSLVIPALLKS